jgi:hypothetical protein
MEVFKDIIEPIIIVVISVSLTAIVTLKTKYATSEDQAIAGLKNIGKKVFFYCWTAWLFYGLAMQVISPEPVTRTSVLLIAVYTSCILLMLIFSLLKSIIEAIAKVVAVQRLHIESQIEQINTEATKERSDTRSAPPRRS